jgi:Skp family chaperone for outer membrane proteins
MAEQTNIVREGFDRVSSAFERIPDEVQKMQRELQKRRKSLGKQLAGSRRDLEKRSRDIEKRTRRQVERLRTEFRRLPLTRRVDRLRTDAEKALERGVDAFLGVLQIASKSDLDRIDKKLGQVSRKLKEIERTRGNGHAASA